MSSCLPDISSGAVHYCHKLDTTSVLLYSSFMLPSIFLSFDLYRFGTNCSGSWTKLACPAEKNHRHSHREPFCRQIIFHQLVKSLDISFSANYNKIFNVVSRYIEEHVQRTGVAIETQGFTFVTSGRKRESLTVTISDIFNYEIEFTI